MLEIILEISVQVGEPKELLGIQGAMKQRNEGGNMGPVLIQISCCFCYYSNPETV